MLKQNGKKTKHDIKVEPFCGFKHLTSYFFTFKSMASALAPPHNRCLLNL